MDPGHQVSWREIEWGAEEMASRSLGSGNCYSLVPRVSLDELNLEDKSCASKRPGQFEWDCMQEMNIYERRAQATMRLSAVARSWWYKKHGSMGGNTPKLDLIDASRAFCTYTTLTMAVASSSCHSASAASPSEHFISNQHPSTRPLRALLA